VTLPFAETIRAVLKSTNLREVNDDADLTIVVKATGEALGARYSSSSFAIYYSGAELSGSLRVTVRSGLYCEGSFKRRVDPPYMVSTKFESTSPSDAPFKKTFDVFVTKLCNIALDLFGVPPLLSALKEMNESLLVGIVKTLGSTSDPTALDALIAALGDESYPVKSVAVETLINMPAAGVSDALGKSLKSSSMDVRSRAALILSERKDCCPVAPLLVAFDDRSGTDDFRSRVALALGASKEPLALRRLVLAARKNNERPPVRYSVLQALGVFQDPTAADTLIEIVENATEDKWARSTAVSSLAQTRDPRAVPILIRALMDPQPNVREGAAFSLRFFREARVVDALIRAISQKDGNTPSKAVESLEKLTNQKIENTVAWQKWWQDNKDTFDQQKQ
jgi:HEAT repeat protein